MAVFNDLTKENETIILDDNEFVSCRFQNCELVYCGGIPPKLQHCYFTHCSWKLDEAAKRTILFLRSIYHSGPGGMELVDGTLKFIRSK